MLELEFYISEWNELEIIDTNKIDELVNLNNCHLFVKYLRRKNPKLIEAIVNEYEAQERFDIFYTKDNR